MKKISLAVLAAAALNALLIFNGALAFAGQASASKVTAYYFHGSARCPTCHKLEQYSREAIETNFKDELASGRLEFKVVNLEDKGNEHYVNDYQLYTRSLVISLVDNGKEVKSKNLIRIWDYAGDREKFFDYVTGEINDFLKGK